MRATTDAVDVVVVGAGAAGLATALGLARRGVSVDVVDVARPPRVPWTEVHHWSVLAGLHDLGVLDDLLRRGTRRTRWELRVLMSGERIPFDLGDLRADVPHPYALRVSETDLLEVLTEHLLALPGTRVLQGPVRAVVTGTDEATVTYEGRGGNGEARGHWVVAADGPASVPRREAGIAFPGTSGAERTVVAVVDHDFAGQGYAETTFQVDGQWGAVVELVGGTTWRYVFQEPLEWSEEGVPARIVDVLGHVTGRSPLVLDWNVERTHQRTAVAFRRGRTVLVGDSAHLTHRLIGHSSIAAWCEAFSLAEVLAGVVAGTDHPSTLDAWAHARRRSYLSDAVPASISRRNLVAQIRDPSRLALELEDFRRALADVAVRRDVLMRGRELAVATSATP